MPVAVLTSSHQHLAPLHDQQPEYTQFTSGHVHTEAAPRKFWDLVEPLGEDIETLKMRRALAYAEANNMDSIEVRFKAPATILGNPVLNLNALDNDRVGAGTCVAIDAELISGSGRVYKANLKICSKWRMDVAVKFGFGKRGREELSKEAKFYNNELLEAQEIMVPKFIGLFGASVLLKNGKSETVTCLVVRFVGKALPCSFWDLPAEQRLSIFVTCQMLHACGLEHGDLHEGNIRFEEDKQRAWIIDFTHAKKHDCRRKQLVLGDDVPEFSEYGCEELYDMAIDTRVWISYGNFHFGRASFWLKDIRKLDDLFKWTPSDLPENDRIRLAREGLELAKAIREQKMVEYYAVNSIFWSSEPV